MTLASRPRITAEITFLLPEENGRVQAPIFSRTSTYRPHMVVQSRDARAPIVGPGNVVNEPYQGVAFLEGPATFRLGDTGRFVLDLMYYPQHRYADVQPGAAFTVREGSKIVAHGVVLSRLDPA